METADCRRHGYILSDKTLGSGTYAKVKLARVMERKIAQTTKLREDLRTKGHNMVAIKIISKRKSPTEYLTKFMPREIDAMRITHKHANLIQLYEFFRTERGVYLVLEYASHGDILSYINDSVLETGMAVEEDKARQLFRQIVSGVTFCHNRNVVHRDLKCENVLLDENWNVKISDFGFACRFPSNRCNMLSTFCGSYAYAAPEILAGKKYDGKLADVWSLGIILYALVNGRLPFNDQNLNTLMDQTKKKIKFQPWVSKDCIHLIRRMLRQRPLLRMRANEIIQHPWVRREPICNTWHEGAAAMYENDPSFNKRESFSRFMTMTESVYQKQRKDRRATIHDAQQQTMNTLMQPKTTEPTTTPTKTTMMAPTSKGPYRGRSSPPKTPVLLADGRIVKRELNGLTVEEKKKPQEAERYEYGPEHNKYYGAKLVNLKKKLDASKSSSTPPNYASTMRTRMRNLYRRILATNPAGEHLFDMENETGKCLMSKKYKPTSRVVDAENRNLDNSDSPVDGTERAITGKHREKGIYIPTQETHESMNDAAFDNIMPEVSNPIPTSPSTTLTIPGKDSSLPIATVAVANRLQTGGSHCSRRATSVKAKATTPSRLPTPVISNELHSDKDLSLTSTSPPCIDDETSAATSNTTTNEKMLPRRGKAPRSKLKNSTPLCFVSGGQGSSVNSHAPGAALKTSDLYSHVQNLPVLKKMAD